MRSLTCCSAGSSVRSPTGVQHPADLDFLVEARRIELPNLLHAMQALYQLSYAPGGIQTSRALTHGLNPMARAGAVSSSRVPQGRHWRLNWALIVQYGVVLAEERV
jgi:hypothetical protein